MNFYANICFAMGHKDVFPYNVGTHVHFCYEIIYYIYGTGISQIDGVDYKYSDHTFCIIPPDTPHSEYAITPTELVYIGFEYDGEAGELPVAFLADPEEEIVGNMQFIRNEIESRRYLYEEMLQHLQQMLILQILRKLPGAPTFQLTNLNAPLEYAANYIISNYFSDIKLPVLAKTVGYSYDRFQHLFRDAYGVSPLRFILNTRIENAKQMLSTESYSVFDIAKRCGFHSSAQFISTFKKFVGHTPYQYRKLQKQYIEKAEYFDENNGSQPPE